MGRRAKWIGVGILVVLVTFGVFTATYRPLPYPFLNKFRVAGEAVDHRGQAFLFLDAGYEEVLKEAQASIGCFQVSSAWEGAYCGQGGQDLIIGPDFVHVREDGSRFPVTERCVVSYSRSGTLTEKAWTWIKDRLGRGEPKLEPLQDPTFALPPGARARR